MQCLTPVFRVRLPDRVPLHGAPRGDSGDVGVRLVPGPRRLPAQARPHIPPARQLPRL